MTTETLYTQGEAKKLLEDRLAECPGTWKISVTMSDLSESGMYIQVMRYSQSCNMFYGRCYGSVDEALDDVFFQGAPSLLRTTWPNPAWHGR